MVMVDDATNRIGVRFSEEETTRASYDVLEKWVRQNGLPGSLYVDRDSIYRCEGQASVAEQLAGKERQTQFGRAMAQLGVELILANSPQAKGRVERMNGVLQDRLVKALRLAGISDRSGGAACSGWTDSCTAWNTYITSAAINGSATTSSRPVWRSKPERVPCETTRWRGEP